MTMNRWIVSLCSLAFLAMACSTTPSGPECSSPADCVGDPGVGCSWACIDGSCDKLCDQGCAVAADCDGLPWTVRCVGHWECRSSECVEVCDGQGCQTAADCEDLAWEVNCPGHWECEGGECTPVCDQSECTSAADCQSGQLPCQFGGQWTCQSGACVAQCEPECSSIADCEEKQLPCEAGGYWTCPNGSCEPVCDAPECVNNTDCNEIELPCENGGHWECTVGLCVPHCPGIGCQGIGDCLDLPWDIYCTGHWECSQGSCEQICDSDGCSDGYCGAGETISSCPEDCDQSCIVPGDCEEFEFPLDCEGYWDCQDNWCVPICGGGECSQASDCLAHEWSIYCMGHWECWDGSCEEQCDDESCGDYYCDELGGESAMSCPLDCHNEQCVQDGMLVSGGLECCAGLTQVDNCMPGEACPGMMDACINCMGYMCDPRENQYNCPTDCPEGCWPGDVRDYLCQDGSQVSWCECLEHCEPICMTNPDGMSGWVDSCTYEIIAPAQCANCSAQCMYIGVSGQEGWYSDCSSAGTEPELILLGPCAPFWECAMNPVQDCR